MKKLPIILLSTIFFVFACNETEPVPSGGGSASNVWDIPSNEVFSGGPGKDGIPAVDNPVFISASEANLEDDQLVVGFRHGNTVRAYPHNILDWHEIVNDQIDALNFSIVYCPLTGSATVWNREFNGSVTTFGVSGLLYNSNIIPYDRETDSNWSQMELACVQGELRGLAPEGFNLVETTWSTWRALYPDTEVLSTETGFSRNYARYPYGSYRTDNSIIFPISNPDDRLHPKERVLGVVADDETKAYVIKDFVEGKRVKEDNIGGTPVVLVGHENLNFAVGFGRELNGNQRSFTAVDNNAPIFFQDDLGNQYDLFGYVVSGPNQGNQLSRVESFIGYWFAWGTFKEGLELYGQ